MDSQVMVIIAGMALVSFLPRALPLLLLNKINFPPWLIKWLGFVPAAVLSALLAPDLFLDNGYFNVSAGNPYLIAAIPTLVIALVTRSMIWALLGGMGSFALLQMM